MSSTDVLKAERILVDDRIYRLLPIKDSLNVSDEEKIIRNPRFVDDDDYDDDDLPIVHQGDRFNATIYVPAPLIGYIVGGKHKNIDALKKQYNARISIPDKKNIEAGITIQGSTRRSVASVYTNIQNKLNKVRFNKEFTHTHFISFPVNFSNIQDSFLKFKDEVLKKYNRVRGIDASIFQKPSQLHLTVTMLTLFDDRDKENAIAILNKCVDSFFKELGEKEIVVRVQGLEIMNDDEGEVDVLYAKLIELDNDNRLQILADKIMKEYASANLSKDHYEKVKLHITVMNTVFRERLGNTESEERITFDARQIMKEYKEYDFGEISISEIHISVRYTEASDGFYSCIHKMKFKS